MVRHASCLFFEKLIIFKVGIHDALLDREPPSSPPSQASPQAVGRLPPPHRRRLGSSSAIAGMMHAVVEHDGWCAIYQNCPCSCTPNISLIPVDGGHGVYVIDERGQARKTGKQ